MFKFIRAKTHAQDSEARLKVQKELFAFNKSVQHGFLHRPTALAFDPKLKLLAIGSKNGVVKIFGVPGVEFVGQHNSDSSVTQIFFLPNQGRLISLLDDNTLHLWEVNIKDGKSVLEQVKSCSLEGRLKKISTCCLQSNSEHLLLGTEGGNIYLLDVKNFEMTDHIIYQDVVMQNVPDDYKINPGAVETLAEHPTNPDKLLIGYNRGLMVLWDNKTLNAEQTYVCSQQLESVAWHRNGTEFMSAHNDGSYVIWSASDSSKPEQAPNTPYGPFPCKAITKILWKCTKSDPYIIFSGGMPRASYGDRHTVTVTHGEKHVVFDFTSRVIDFFTISDSDEEYEYDDPHSLVVLVEEEIVVIDLQSENWPAFKAPYLSSLHSSAITCAQFAGNVPNELWNKIIAAGDLQTSNFHSQREWPICGGKNLANNPLVEDLLLTGHEDGTVRFWDASSVSLRLLYKLSTSHVFTGEDQNEHTNNDEAEEWPPFRKVGTFDPYSDDPRLGIQKISLCVLTGTLIIAGTAGQVLVLEMEQEEKSREIDSVSVNIVSDRDNFVWKGHEALIPKEGSLKFAPGFQVATIIQLSPPAACTALALHSEWALLAAGTAHGFALIDYLQKKVVISKCILNPNDMSATADSSMSRRKSFKKSLRESFRRLRKGRSGRSGQKKDKTPPRVSVEEQKSPTSPSATEDETQASTEPRSPSPPSNEAKPIERSVEARGTVDDTMGSMVRCLHLAETFIINGVTHTPTMWAGTNSGAIFVFTISLPAAEKRNVDAVSCQLGKEIQLKHRAPVIALSIVDATGYTLPDSLDVKHERAKAADMSGNHKVVICSEEQFKVFYLPSLKPYCKFKLTAHEGARVRKIGFVNFKSRNDENYSENCITCLSNQGELSIYSIPSLRRQLLTECIRKEDINGISSLVFTKNGQGFYLHSPSEFQRFTLSARFLVEPLCMLELPEGMRPIPEPEPHPKTDATVNSEKTEREQGPTDAKTSPAKGSEGAAETPTINGSVDEASARSDSQNVEDERKNDGDLSPGDITIDSVRDHFAIEINREEISNEVNTRPEESSPIASSPPPIPVSNSTDDAEVQKKRRRTSSLEVNAPITELEERSIKEEHERRSGALSFLRHFHKIKVFK